ncbi:MAG: type II toxin-antitoxin system RelE/ParE family toxin [Acidobacteria bacterium]|nr:type II toxin-antitoxin system RelE/ParE family toxin [Acidobacteriota bacterium]
MAEEQKLYSFIETTVLTRQVTDAGSIDLLIAIQNDLLKNPERGDVVKGSHGARKARIADPHDSRGKRGSYRYLYYYRTNSGQIYLLYLFAKNEQSNLSPDQTKWVAEMVDLIKSKENE